MTRLEELILLLRSHAHEVPEHCGQLMREAARELDRRRDMVLVGELGHAPFPPPVIDSGKHRRPKGADDGLRGVAASKEIAPCR